MDPSPATKQQQQQWLPEDIKGTPHDYTHIGASAQDPLKLDTAAVIQQRDGINRILLAKGACRSLRLPQQKGGKTTIANQQYYYCLQQTRRMQSQVQQNDPQERVITATQAQNCQHFCFAQNVCHNHAVHHVMLTEHALAAQGVQLSYPLHRQQCVWAQHCSKQAKPCMWSATHKHTPTCTNNASR
jgi:hypothetical protein